MNKIKKTIIWSIIIITAVGILTFIFYSFNQVQIPNNKTKILSDLNQAQNRLTEEESKLKNVRQQSYWYKVSSAEYLKTKKLVARTDVFFKDPNGVNPKIQLITKNQIITDEINLKRQKINKLLEIWNQNNDLSLQTDSELIKEIQNYLLIIQAYLNQLQDITSNLSADNNLTTEQITNYNSMVQESSTELINIINIITKAETIITNSSNTNATETEINTQIQIILEIKNDIDNLENKLNEQNIITATTTTDITNTIDEEEEKNDIDKNQNYQGIIYTVTPTPHRESGVDIDIDSTKPTVLQDW